MSFLVAGPGAAEPVGGPGQIHAVIGIADPAHAGADALALSRAVLKQGGEARRLESPSPDQLHQALDQARRRAGAEAGQLIIALSAGLREEGGAILLEGFGPEAIPLAGIMDRLAPYGPDDVAVSLGQMALPATPGPATAMRVLLLLEGCGAEARVSPAAMPIRRGLAIALVPDADMACDMAEGPLAVMAGLIADGQSLAALEDSGAFGWFHDPETPLEDLLPLIGMVEAPDPVSAAPAGAYRAGADRVRQPIILGEAAAVSGAGHGDVILLPSGAGTAVRTMMAGQDNAGRGNAASYRTDYRPQQGAGASADGGATIQQASAPAQPQRPPRLGGYSGAAMAAMAGYGQAGAMAPRPGMPQPSIIVGHLTAPAADQAADRSVLSGDVMDTGAETRHRIRAEDPDLFARLLTEGILDPDPEDIAGAIQADLARLGCYQGALDGLWGNGSRMAVSTYLAEIGADPVSQEADIALFRQIAGGPDVRCPAPVSTPAVAATGGRGGQSRAAPAPQSGAAAGRAPANADPAPGPNAGGVRGNLSNAIRGSGIIR